MTEQKIEALILDAGTSLKYFTGISWWPGERPMVAIIPAKGETKYRTGHGIGMDGHEWGNIVKGNTQLLQPDMCFSIESTIAIPGEFGIRLEDCIYMTAEGAKSFAPFAKSISEPFG